jgi:GNAT superfamily N-acetyltransferase
MCRDVYGGTDYMPRVIEHLGELSEGVVAATNDDDDDDDDDDDGKGDGDGGKGEQRTILLVAEEEEEEGDEEDASAAADNSRSSSSNGRRQVGVVVAQLRGEGHAFLFGLRVDARARSRGVGRALMRAACAAAAAEGATRLVGATIPSNAASISLFVGTGHREHSRVAVWPPFSVLAGYERAVGFAPPRGRRPPGKGDDDEGDERPRYGVGARGGADDGASSAPSVRLVDHLPGVRRLLESVAAPPTPEPPRRCESVDELSRALAEVRRRAGASSSSSSSTLPPWVPAMFEVMPARGPWARERVREGMAWVLPAVVGGGLEAVVVGAPSFEARRFVVGVVAANGDAAVRALRVADERLAPPGGHFLAFVDAPMRIGSGDGDGGDDGGACCALSRLLALSARGAPDAYPEGAGCMVVYHREVVADAGAVDLELQVPSGGGGG